MTALLCALRELCLRISRNVPSVLSPVEDHLSAFGVDVRDVIGATGHLGRRDIRDVDGIGSCWIYDECG